MQVGDRVDAWTLMLEMNIPLQQGSRRSQEREAERMLEAAAARKEALGHRLHGELNGAVANLEALLDAQRQITNARLALLRAQASQQQRLADIERLLGEDL